MLAAPDPIKDAVNMKSKPTLLHCTVTLLLSTLLAACGQQETGAAAASERNVAAVTPEPATLRTEYHEIKLVQVAAGLQRPWSVAFLPDGGYLVTERPGRLNRVHPDGEVTPISGVPEVHAANQGGLLDVSLHPDYADNGWVYLTYSAGGPEGTATALARGRLEGAALVEVERLFEQDRQSRPGMHYGSRLAWMEDGTLLMTVGDRGLVPARAQDPGDHAGTVLRLTDDGRPAEGNPFAADDGARTEIYSYGHRNIQGIVVGAEGTIWAAEHGPRGGDELNLIRPGQNYGWPVVSRGRDYRTEQQWGEGRSREGMVEPVYELAPTVAPSGLALVTAGHFPRWQGNLLVGGLRSQSIRRLVIEDGVVVHDEELRAIQVGRIRDVREGPDGNIYFVTDEDDGALYRIEPVR
jgi:aldose sugar dehydrogenase